VDQVLLGYGYSYTPSQERFSTAEIADLFHELMTETFGYPRFAAHGRDLGAPIFGVGRPCPAVGTFRPVEIPDGLTFEIREFLRPVRRDARA